MIASPMYLSTVPICPRTMSVIGVRYSFKNIVSSTAEKFSERVVNERRSQNISVSLRCWPPSSIASGCSASRSTTASETNRPKIDRMSLNCFRFWPYNARTPARKTAPEERLGETGSSNSPYSVKPSQLMAVIAPTASAPKNALASADVIGTATTSSSEIRVAANSSAPSAQSGRSNSAPPRICSINCAWASTPGVDGLSGVATTSDSIEALAPITTTFPARSERSAPASKSFQAGVDKRGSGGAKYARISPPDSLRTTRSPTLIATIPELEPKVASVLALADLRM